MEQNTTKIQFDKVSVWRNQTHILTDVNWQVSQGQHWAILGPNGSGKTSMIMALFGFLPFSHGRLFVLDGWLGHIDMPAQRRKIGMVSHTLGERFLRNMPRATAVEVILTGQTNTFWLIKEISDSDRRRARDILAELGCAHLAQVPFRRLSSGERQAALMARSILADNQLVLLDEPCASLDLGARERLLAIVQKMVNRAPKLTLVYITHHPEEIVPGITHLLLLKEGRVQAAGPIAAIMQSDLLSRTYDLPLQVAAENGRYWVRSQ